MMRKTRDYDAELRALSDKAKSIKAKKVEQLGLLVTGTGADALDLDTLAGALLAAVESADAEEKEAWRSRGAAFFQGRGRKAWRRTGGDGEGGGQAEVDARVRDGDVVGVAQRPPPAPARALQGQAQSGQSPADSDPRRPARPGPSCGS